MDFGTFAQAAGCLLWRYVTLRLGEQFEADHEFAHSGRAEQWRHDMDVPVPVRVGPAASVLELARGPTSQPRCDSGAYFKS